MADIQLPGKGMVRAYQGGPEANMRAAAAPWAALQGVGEAIGQLGERELAFMAKQREAQARTRANQMELDLLKFDTEQQNQILTNPDPAKWLPNYESALAKKREQWLTTDLSPEDREALTQRFDEFAVTRANVVARNAAVATFQNQKTAWANNLDYAAQTGNRGLQDRTLAEMRLVLPEADVAKVEAESGRRLAFQEIRSQILDNPHATAEKLLERGEDGSFKHFPELDAGQRANLKSEAQSAYVGKLKEWSDWADDEMASGRITQPEQLDARFAGNLPPRVIERLKQNLAERQSEAWKAKIATPEYQNQVVGKVESMLANYRIGADGFDEAFVEMDALVKSLPAGSAVRDGLNDALSHARSGQRAIIADNAGVARAALQDAYKAGRFGPTEFKPMKVADAIQGGFLRDGQKLADLGFTDDQRKQILAEKSDPARRELFQAFWTQRGQAKADVDPLVWKTAEAIRTGADDAQWLSGDDQGKLDATHRNYGKARTEFENWLRANPNADGAKVSEKIRELGGQADASHLRQSLILPRPGADVGDGVLPPRATSYVPPRGSRITSYGYAGDETPDANSAAGIGAWVSDAEAARIRAGEDAPNRLRAGDIAVSPDVERQLVAAGVSPTQEITVRFADGRTHTGRWMDRTRGDLRGRIDLYSPDGPSALNGTPVVGWAL